jgi:hypothetical protein
MFLGEVEKTQPRKGKGRRAFERALMSDVEMQRKFPDYYNRLLSESTNRASGGYVPNFADPLREAISREIGAGVNPSQVYVDQHSSLKNSGNPMGLMVANRRDEPSGGYQGINRARKEGQNAQTYGAAGGFVPNFAGPMGGADTNMLTKLFALQVGVSMLTGFLDQAGESGQRVSDSLNKLMSTLLIFGTIIYAGPIKALKEFSDKDIDKALKHLHDELDQKRKKVNKQNINNLLMDLKKKFEFTKYIIAKPPTHDIEDLTNAFIYHYLDNNFLHFHFL